MSITAGFAKQIEKFTPALHNGLRGLRRIRRSRHDPRSAGPFAGLPGSVKILGTGEAGEMFIENPSAVVGNSELA